MATKPAKQPWNIFDAEEAMIERLKFATQTEQNGMPAWCRKVGTRQDMANVTNESSQIVPAIYFVYKGFRVIDSAGGATKKAFKWVIVLVVSNAAAQRTSTELNKEAGEYLHRIESAFDNFTPPAATSRLQELTPPEPYYSSTHAYFPLCYEVESIFFRDRGMGVGRPSPINRPFTPTVKN